jgi:hypothetical protein
VLLTLHGVRVHRLSSVKKDGATRVRDLKAALQRVIVSTAAHKAHLEGALRGLRVDMQAAREIVVKPPSVEGVILPPAVPSA